MKEMNRTTEKKQIDFLLSKVELKITFPIGEPIKIDCETHFERDAVCISPEVEDAIVEIALEQLGENTRTHLDSVFKEKKYTKNNKAQKDK